MTENHGGTRFVVMAAAWGPESSLVPATLADVSSLLCDLTSNDPDFTAAIVDFMRPQNVGVALTLDFVWDSGIGIYVECTRGSGLAVTVDSVEVTDAYDHAADPFRPNRDAAEVCGMRRTRSSVYGPQHVFMWAACRLGRDISGPIPEDANPDFTMIGVDERGRVHRLAEVADIVLDHGEEGDHE